MKVLMLHGINHNMFGQRDPTQYGTVTLAQIDAQLKALGKELGNFEAYLSGDYLAGELSAADITLYPLIALGLRMEQKKPDLDVRSAIGPKLGAWMKRFEALPYFDKTYPPHWRQK